MCAMQNHRMEMMCYYDARLGVAMYGGLFNPLTYLPFCTYYGLKAFGELYVMGTQIECSVDNPAVYALAATDGKKTGILIANTGDDTEICSSLGESAKVYLIDEEHMMEEVAFNADNFQLKQNQVVYIEEV